MEGWYTKITTTEHRIGTIVGIFTDKNNKQQGYVAILRHDKGKLSVTESYTDSFEVSRYDRIPAHFKVTLGDIATLTNKYLTIKLRDGTLFVQIMTKDPWKTSSLGLGPESVGVFLPFKSHWYVHRFDSRATFDLVTSDGREISGRGFAHQEKNWGKTFPSGWIWAQGSTSDGKYHVALAGGELDILRRKAYLIGIKTPRESITFHPLHSVVKSEIDACEGRVKFRSIGMAKSVEITVEAPRSSFSPLSVPGETGFEHGAKESFAATTKVKVFKGPKRNKLIREFTVEGSALEFGGTYQCP